MGTNRAERITKKNNTKHKATVLTMNLRRTQTNKCSNSILSQNQVRKNNIDNNN